VLEGGGIQQVGTPLTLYERPCNTFVAQFIGSPAMNIVQGKVTSTGASTAVQTEKGGAAELPIASTDGDQGQSVQLGVRPEDLVETTGDDFIFEGQVEAIEALGETTNLYFARPGGADAQFIAKLPGIRQIKRGDTIRLTAPPEKMHLFDSAGISYLYR